MCGALRALHVPDNDWASLSALPQWYVMQATAMLCFSLFIFFISHYHRRWHPFPLRYPLLPQSSFHRRHHLYHLSFIHVSTESLKCGLYRIPT